MKIDQDQDTILAIPIEGLLHLYDSLQTMFTEILSDKPKEFSEKEIAYIEGRRDAYANLKQTMQETIAEITGARELNTETTKEELN